MVAFVVAPTNLYGGAIPGGTLLYTSPVFNVGNAGYNSDANEGPAFYEVTLPSVVSANFLRIRKEMVGEVPARWLL